MRSADLSLFSFLRPYPELRTVVVNLKSGTVFRGLIWRHAGPYLILREAAMLADRDNRAAHLVDGEVAVLRADVDFIQVLAQTEAGR